MAQVALTVLLIEDSPHYAQLVQQWLSDAPDGVTFELNWTDTLAAGMSRLGKGGVDVILLDLGLPDSNGIQTYSQTRARAPETPTLVLSSTESEPLALQLIQKGAEDYLVKERCDRNALIRAVRYAVVRRKSPHDHDPLSPRNQVIGVIGSKGGVGTTTIACTLASELRVQTDQEVLLADLDPDGGNVSFFAGIDNKYSVQDAASNIHRLDLDRWEAIVARTPDGLSVIASGTLPGDHRLQTGSFREVLRFTRPLYRWTVLDLGRLNQDSLTLLGAVGEVFVVTTAAIPALYNAKCATEALRTAEVEPERIRIIVNHAGPTPPFSLLELNSMFGVPVHGTIPEDSEELFVACVEKRLPSAHSHIRQAVAALARKLTGQTERPRRAKFSSLLSLTDKFKRPPEGPASTSILT